jgi:hypothetical protein
MPAHITLIKPYVKRLFRSELELNYKWVSVKANCRNSHSGDTDVKPMGGETPTASGTNKDSGLAVSNVGIA